MADPSHPTVSVNVGVEGRSPLSLASLADLLFRPTTFFRDTRRLTTWPHAAFVAWVSGIAYTMGRVDQNIMKAEFGQTRTGWADFGPWLTESWLNYWLFALAVGAFNGWILWYLGGWWYRKRLDWSGAVNATPEIARPVYVYQDLVVSAPTLLVTAIQAVVYSSYAEAWKADEYWSSISLLIFVFWSCVTSYRGATTVYVLSRRKAQMWFLVLPIVLLGLALGLLATAYAFMSGASQ